MNFLEWQRSKRVITDLDEMQAHIGHTDADLPKALILYPGSVWIQVLDQDFWTSIGGNHFESTDLLELEKTLWSMWIIPNSLDKTIWRDGLVVVCKEPLYYIPEGHGSGPLISIRQLDLRYEVGSKFTWSSGYLREFETGDIATIIDGDVVDIVDEEMFEIIEP
jgi:hypothetical protein